MKIIKFLSGLALVGSIFWFISAPDYEPGIAIITSLSAFVAAWLVDRRQMRQTNQHQTVAENSVGIQAGGDVNIGDIQVSRKAKDAE